MIPMQFRGFVFPSNPESITVRRGNRILTHFCPGKGEILQNLGEQADTITCRGHFWSGSVWETQEQIDQFLAETKEQASGLLFLPYGRPILSSLREFTLQQEGDGCLIPYTMVFVREGAPI